MDNYNKKISGVFQNFQKYKMSLKDNIIISESDESKENKVEECLSNVDINVKDFPDGIQTVLSTEFGGIDVSGGQWQRLAIARGFYKDSEIIVLDEPTAAIDPLEEYEVYNNFKKIAKNKIALLVTHRMGSCKIADRIIVVDDGQIVEEGTHEELMNKNGYYHKMYEAQAQWYN
jgi:ATP-binding cassette subfamily B protein